MFNNIRKIILPGHKQAMLEIFIILKILFGLRMILVVVVVVPYGVLLYSNVNIKWKAAV